MQLMEFDPDRNFIRGFGYGVSQGPRTDAQSYIWATGLQRTTFPAARGEGLDLHRAYR
jgi:hypothetical protein